MKDIILRRLGFPPSVRGGGTVQRIDGSYLYELGTKFRPVLQMAEEETTRIDAFMALYDLKQALQGLLYGSVISSGLRTALGPGRQLLDQIRAFVPDPGTNEQIDWEEKIPGWRFGQVKHEFRRLETVLLAELQTTPLYYASPKGGYDTAALTDNGESLFPADLNVKVPTALADVRAAARCIAFDLPTAAAFHLHRAAEAVLRAYFDEVAGKSNRPRTRNMGDYIKKMEKLGVGDAKVIEVLRSLKDLHRNPIMHPEDSIQSIDEALSLNAAVRAAIGYMLDRIPTPQVPATPTPVSPLVQAMASALQP